MLAFWAEQWVTAVRRNNQWVCAALDILDGDRFSDWAQTNLFGPTYCNQDGKILKFYVGQPKLCPCSLAT